MAENPAQHVTMAMWGPQQWLTHHFSTKTRCMGAQALASCLFSGTKWTLPSTCEHCSFCEGGPPWKRHYIYARNILCPMGATVHCWVTLCNTFPQTLTKHSPSIGSGLLKLNRARCKKSCSNIACGCCGMDKNLTPIGLLSIHLKRLQILIWGLQS